MNYSFPAPRNWLALPEAERKARAFLTDDLCTTLRSPRFGEMLRRV
jgi:hypothetical protein